MLELVTQDDARAQLRLDEVDSTGGADDVWLSIWIPAVSEAVRTWLKVDARLYVPERTASGAVVIDSSGNPVPEVDSSGTPTVHPLVRAAVLIELASQYRYREGEGENGTPTGDLYSGRYGYILTAAGTSLLMALRRSTIV